MEPGILRLARSFLASLLLLAIARPKAMGQVSTGAALTVAVIDTDGRPLANALVTVLQGVSTTVASASTNADGLVVIPLAVSGELQLRVQRLGYQVAYRVLVFVGVTRVSIAMARVVTALDTVRVTAEATLKRQRLTIDGEAIAASTRPIFDAVDVITKLRPNMIFGLYEKQKMLGGGGYVCPPARYVWVNGVRIRNAPADTRMVQRKHDISAALSELGLHHPPQNAYLDLPIDVLSVLASIRPEHIDHMEFRDCADMSMGRLATEAALFITLKNGVGYEWGVGSRAIAQETMDSLARRVVARRPPTQALEGWRVRILGLFDDGSGLPVAQADVEDLSTGNRVETSETGTVSLGFLAPGETRLRIRGSGYRVDTLAVHISPADSLPLTVLLRRQ
jgi:Carboxypeptidase regulatory-like domain